MNSFLLKPGRIFAADEAEARELVRQELEAKGYTVAGEIRPRPCPVQPRDLIWYEYYVRVREIEA